MRMSIPDQKWHIEGGFILFRLELRREKIKVAKVPGIWRTYRKYPTKKECQEAWDFLMVNHIYIEA